LINLTITTIRFEFPSSEHNLSFPQLGYLAQTGLLAAGARGPWAVPPAIQNLNLYAPYGIWAVTSFESTLSLPLESTAVVT